jgi:4,5-dihydroxyphthalate decarboxylase
MSFSSFAIAMSKGDRRLVGIPVFLSRSFRHSTIYLRSDSDIQDASDLVGKRIGVPEYQMTASVWTRGLLKDEYGIEASDVTWVTGGMEQPGRAERQALTLPESIRTERVIESTLVEALIDGSIDALMAPRVPRVFRQSESPIRRLWPDFAERERDYFARTGLFPIMHIVAMRAEVFAENPWLAQELAKAFEAAKRLTLDGAEDAPALRWTLPFMLDAIERDRDLFGGDPWPYGLQANRSTVEVFVRYLREQGLVHTDLQPEDLFVASTHTEARI